jgi:hypothetical protein
MFYVDAKKFDIRSFMFIFYILCKVPSAPLWRIGRALSMEEGCQIITESMTVDYSE